MQEPQHKPPHPRAFAGIGILGVLIAVAIMMYLYFGPTGSGGKSSVERALDTKKQGEQLNYSIQARGLAQAIVAHKLGGDGSDPTTYEDMGLSSSSYLDTWGNQMTFRIDANPRQVVLISHGPDGEAGTDDDLQGVAAIPM